MRKLWHLAFIGTGLGLLIQSFLNQQNQLAAVLILIVGALYGIGLFKYSKEF